LLVSSVLHSVQSLFLIFPNTCSSSFSQDKNTFDLATTTFFFVSCRGMFQPREAICWGVGLVAELLGNFEVLCLFYQLSPVQWCFRATQNMRETIASRINHNNGFP
jgi:hypothetical protein